MSAPVKAVIEQQQTEQSRADHLVREVAEPIIGQCRKEQAEREDIEGQAQEEQRAHGM